MQSLRHFYAENDEIHRSSVLQENRMYTLTVVAIGVLAVVFFLIILGGLLHEMTRHKRRKL